MLPIFMGPGQIGRHASTLRLHSARCRPQRGKCAARPRACGPPTARRARAAQVFGNSPDETAYCRLVLNRETVPDALVMLQPTLLAYSLDAPPQPVRAAPALDPAPRRPLCVLPPKNVPVGYVDAPRTRARARRRSAPGQECAA